MIMTEPFPRLAPLGSKPRRMLGVLTEKIEELNTLEAGAREIAHSLSSQRAPMKLQKQMYKVIRQISLTRYQIEIAVRETE
jgi:hypothetical protein